MVNSNSFFFIEGRYKWVYISAIYNRIRLIPKHMCDFNNVHVVIGCDCFHFWSILHDI